MKKTVDLRVVAKLLDVDIDVVIEKLEKINDPPVLEISHKQECL